MFIGFVGVDREDRDNEGRDGNVRIHAVPEGLKLGGLRFFAFGFGIHQRHTLRLVQIQSRLLGEWISAARLRANVWLRIKGDYPASGKLTLAGMGRSGLTGSEAYDRVAGMYLSCSILRATPWESDTIAWSHEKAKVTRGHEQGT
jgi:hypothetical protein